MRSENRGHRCRQERKAKGVLLIPVLLLIFIDLPGETVTATGKAYMGHHITLEEAEKIALNKASQQALDSFGVFIESITEVKNGLLTKEMVRGISGAIMTRKIVSTEKEIENDVIVIVVTAEFGIDNDSLNRALKSYLDRSRDKETIEHLLETVQKLQKRLRERQDSNLDSLEALETLEELDFNNKKLEKLLTTRQVIDHEFEIYEIYKEKIKRCIRSFLADLVDDIQTEYRWDTVPRIVYQQLYIPHIKGRLGTLRTPEYCLPIKIIVDEYAAKKFKIIPKLTFTVRFKMPVILHINNNSTVALHLDVCIYSHLYNTFISLGMTGAWNNGILIPKKYTLSNIQDIDVSIGNPDYRGIYIVFHGPGGDEKERLFSGM